MTNTSKILNRRPSLSFALIGAIAAVLVLSLTLELSQTSYSTEPPQSANGGGNTELPDGTPTHFGFAATRHAGKVSGFFECQIAFAGGKIMDVKGTVTGLSVAADGSSAMLTGPVTVTGFGAGTGTFTAVVTPGAAEVGTITLTTDTDGSGVEGDAGDGGEGPFNEVVTSGSIQVRP